MNASRALALCAIAPLTPATRADVVFELDTVGVGQAPVVMDASGDPLFGLGFAVEWDLTYDALAPSLGSELHLLLEHVPSGFMFSLDGLDTNPGDTGPDDVLLGWGNESGIFTSQGVVDFGLFVPGPQDWRLTITDELDTPGVDGVLFGHVTVRVTPAPHAITPLALAFFFTRRRG
ncbi:MAG: hypothetical protein ACIARR_03650 [Phycisphaerales bacterium JB059]